MTEFETCSNWFHFEQQAVAALLMRICLSITQVVEAIPTGCSVWRASGVFRETPSFGSDWVSSVVLADSTVTSNNWKSYRTDSQGPSIGYNGHLTISKDSWFAIHWYHWQIGRVVQTLWSSWLNELISPSLIMAKNWHHVHVFQFLHDPTSLPMDRGRSVRARCSGPPTARWFFFDLIMF